MNLTPKLPAMPDIKTPELPDMPDVNGLSDGNFSFRTAMGGTESKTYALDVNGGANGTRVHLWEHGATNENQRIRIKSCGGGECYLVAARSGLYLSARNGGSANGTEVVSSSAKDKWKISGADKKGAYVITHAASGKALDISGAKMANGVSAILHQYHGNDNQKFLITKFGS